MSILPQPEPLKAPVRPRFDRHELAGSLGDLGTFLPLLVGMSSQNGLDFGASLFFAGVFNLVTGYTFAIPMAVQPMKAIAAVALSQGLTAPQIMAAGIIVSLVILVLGLTGLIGTLDRVVPRSVVRGLQLSLGLTLITKGMTMISGTHAWLGPDSYATALAAGLVVLMLAGSRVVPAALVLFAAGLALALGQDPGVVHQLRLGFTLPHWSPPALDDFRLALPTAALPQIPLTTLNSVIAVCALSSTLFPDRPASTRKVSVSVGLMNLIAGWFGGMPMCHGAGGLAGQYRFGARTSGSIIALGAAKIVAAVLFGASLMGLCRAFPASVLGVMLMFSGLELGAVFRDQKDRADVFVGLLTAGVSLALNNVGAGFLAGLAAGWLIRAPWVRFERD